jgi:SPP1 gp7 family putative phage head morphogenesis protein
MRARIAQAQFERQLNSVGRQVSMLIKGIAPDGNISLRDVARVRDTLRRYSEALHPWAESVTERMHAEVSQRDMKAWLDLGRTMGRELRLQLEDSRPGMELRDALNQQVELITSLPLKAAQRVHTYAQKLLVESGRAAELQKEILRTGEVTVFQAKRIAHTETSRTASLLTQVRAEHLGSEGYIWRTALDRAVRPLHKKLEGKFIRWGNPPIAGSSGERAHAGQIYFCRCYPEPVIPDQL